MLYSIYLNNFTSGSVTTEEPYLSISFEIESLPPALFILSFDVPFLTSMQVIGKSMSCDVELSDKKEVISSSKLCSS